MAEKHLISVDETKLLYKQEARVGLFQLIPPMHTAGDLMRKYLPVNYGEFWIYFENGYCTLVFYQENMEKITQAVLERCRGGFPVEWQAEWERIDEDLTTTSRRLVGQDMDILSSSDLQKRFDEIYHLDEKMWAISIFIDSFDPGYDQQEMERIAAAQGISEDEIHVLSTPLTPTFVTDWESSLTKLKNGSMTRDELRARFFWYGVSYSSFAEVSDDFINQALVDIHPVEFISPAEGEARIRARHSFDKNPLEVFRTLTAWRDERKRLNYTGLYSLMKIVREAMRRQGFDPLLANYLLPSQLPDLIAGKISVDQLERRKRDVMLAHFLHSEFNFYTDETARENWAIIRNALSKVALSTEIAGIVASRGKATGRVRVILDFADPKAAHFTQSDILVTSMTRPEFMPLIKRCSAIVTDEGGITSHAAIVSRELKKPCIIGTKNATRILHDGDLVEVDADRGVVRIIERK